MIRIDAVERREQRGKGHHFWTRVTEIYFHIEWKKHYNLLSYYILCLKCYYKVICVAQNNT